MKKFATLLLLIACFFNQSSHAQNTACNAEFNIVYQTTNTIQFNPVMTGEPATTQHYWIFGDGNGVNTVSPIHSYLLSGSYTAKHIIIKFSGGIVICKDSFIRVIQIQSPCNLAAGFSFSMTSPNLYHFINTSSPLNISDSIRWTFGDGTSSHDVNPTHSYAQPGTYNVCLRIQQRNSAGTLSNCIGEICHVIIVPPVACNLVAGFSISGTGNGYHFLNTSIPLNSNDSIRWTFGDGTSSHDVNPTHSYAQPGTYNVCLRIQQRNSAGALTGCVREICHPVIVLNPSACNLVAGFIPSALNPNEYHFQNTSTPLSPTDSIRWTFGDGSSSNLVNPNHNYIHTGTYNVCLRIQQRNLNGTLSNCIREICHVVLVQSPTACNLVAGFTAITISQNAFHFENTSHIVNPTDSIRWTFGDGTSSNQMSPTHTYLQPGTYNVCLRIQRRNSAGTLYNCISEICHTVVVLYNTNTCNLVAGFTPTLIAPNAYHFENTSVPLSTTDSIRWTFGDGTSSNQLSPNHTFAHSGTYYVCLRVQKRNSLGTLSNCIREVCHTVVVGTATGCILQPFPNPATNSISVNIFLNLPQMIDIFIFNSSNLLVRERHMQGVAGNNVAAFSIADLMPGVYIMKMVHGNDICYGHFIKL